jgi:hypothetical protein
MGEGGKDLQLRVGISVRQAVAHRTQLAHTAQTSRLTDMMTASEQSGGNMEDKETPLLHTCFAKGHYRTRGESTYKMYRGRGVQVLIRTVHGHCMTLLHKVRSAKMKYTESTN